jgi:hypothetical protein
MAKRDINAYNVQIDRTKTVMRLGRNGILYEYILPTYGNPLEYYNDAIDVKSHNKITGRYQPIGDKRYFNFYQLHKMTQEELIDFMIMAYGDRLALSILQGE